jgi:hypothetical protein
MSTAPDTTATPWHHWPCELVLAVTLPGPPHAWERALPSGQNPPSYRAWLRTATAIVENAWMDPVPGKLYRKRRPPLNEPLIVETAFYLRRPAARPDGVPAWMWEHRDVCIPAIGRMDVDNLAAALFDATTKAGVWIDDTRVSTMRDPRKAWLPVGDVAERSEMRVFRWVGP